MHVPEICRDGLLQRINSQFKTDVLQPEVGGHLNAEFQFTRG